jgi:hypothetical protein
VRAEIRVAANIRPEAEIILGAGEFSDKLLVPNKTNS